jgi:hypothetical protein
MLVRHLLETTGETYEEKRLISLAMASENCVEGGTLLANFDSGLFHAIRSGAHGSEFVFYSPQSDSRRAECAAPVLESKPGQLFQGSVL